MEDVQLVDNCLFEMNADLTFDNPLFEMNEIDPTDSHDEDEIDCRIRELGACTGNGTLSQECSDVLISRVSTTTLSLYTVLDSILYVNWRFLCFSS